MSTLTRLSRRSPGTVARWPLALALAGATLAATAVPVPAAAQTTTQLSTGRGRLVTLSRPMTDVFVANSDIADVQVRSPTMLYVFGKKPGETTVSATARNGAVVWSSTVRIGNNFESLQQVVDLAMPDSQIRATAMNGLVLLTGTVKGPEDGVEAVKLVQAYVGEGTTVLSRLRTATPLQVNLQVKFAEVSRSFLKSIGNNLTSIDGTGGFKFGIGSGRSPGTTITTDPNLPLGVGSSTYGYTIDPTTGQIIRSAGTNVTQGSQRTTIAGLTKLFGLSVLSALDLGETNGQVTTLANPNLTALSGETGTFLAGGEIPIPIPQALGVTSIEFKKFGVSLAYTPTVLSDGRISLRVRPEVSQLDYANAVSFGNGVIPAITTRQVETTVELGSGQSFMIAGLLSNNHRNNFDKTPGLGDVPVLGALFRSDAFQRAETELVVVITPYLVKPVNANDIALPTDGYKAPNDAQRILLGQLQSGTTGGERPKPTMEVGPPVAPAFGAAATVTPSAPLPTGPTLAVPAAGKADRKKKNDDKKSAGSMPAPGFSN